MHIFAQKKNSCSFCLRTLGIDNTDLQKPKQNKIKKLLLYPNSAFYLSHKVTADLKQAEKREKETLGNL